MILVITGNGKGKTTSAIGTAIRGLGWRKAVAIVFFDKGGEHYGEDNVLKTLQPKMEVFRFGLKRFDEKKQIFRFENRPGDFEQAQKAVAKVLELFAEEHFLVIADEILSAVKVGLLQESDLRNVVEKCPPETHLILTGRDAPEWLIEKADLVSEVREIKHPFRKGRKAERGIDY